MIKINQFQIENVKRVKTVAYDCTGKALTVIGGNNKQGKTSILDGIMWTLGGDRFRPSEAIRDGAETIATKVTLSNGIIAERRGQGSLKITSPDGKSGQALLNEFVNQFALNLPKFMSSTDTEKANLLLELFPDLGPTLDDLTAKIKTKFDERHQIGQIALRKKKHAEDLPYEEGLPDEPLTGKAMTDKLQAALATNAKNVETRRRVTQVEQAQTKAQEHFSEQQDRVAELEKRLAEEREHLKELEQKSTDLVQELHDAKKTTKKLEDIDTTELEAEMEEIDTTNARIRLNIDKLKADSEADQLQDEYKALTVTIEDLREQRLKLLAGVDMPLDGLTIDEEGRLLFDTKPWDCMSGSQQLQVAVAISAAIKPDCGFVLIDQMEKMDVKQLHLFAKWLESKDLQAIGTRVSTGPECSLIIEDGIEKGTALPAASSETLTF